MNFIKELQEARMLRDKQDQLSLTYEDAKEKMYLFSVNHVFIHLS